MANDTQISEIGDAMRSAFDHVSQSFTQKESTDKIQAWVNFFLDGDNFIPNVLMSSNNIEVLSGQVFRDVVIYNFVSMLTFSFFSRAELTDISFKAYCQTLSTAIAVDTDRGNSYVPNELSMRGMKSDEVSSVLLNNKWLVTLLTLKLFVRPAKQKQHAGNTVTA